MNQIIPMNLYLGLLGEVRLELNHIPHTLFNKILQLATLQCNTLFQYLS